MKFEPDNELQKFAYWFCVNYKELEPGTYTSEKYKYRIRYLNDLFDGHDIVNRVSNTTGVIEFNRTSLLKHEELTYNFVYFAIVWCVIKFQTKYNDPSVDIIAIEWYLTTQYGQLRESIFIAIAKVFSIAGISDRDFTKDRLEAIKKELLP